MNEDLRLAIVEFRVAKNRLDHLRDEEFPIGSVVEVGQRGKTHGIVHPSDECPPDKLALLFESGNVWWKDAMECKLVERFSIYEPWIKRLKRSEAAHAAAQTRRKRKELNLSN